MSNRMYEGGGLTSLEKPIAVYLRVSTEKQELQNQVLAITEWLRARGMKWEDVDIHLEDVETGSEDERPGFKRLWELVRMGAVRSVVVFEVSRLSRKQRTLVNFLYDCVDKGVAVYSVRETFLAEWFRDPRSRTIVVGLLSILYDLERQLISERTRAGMARVRMQGKRVGRRPKLTARDIAVVKALRAQGVPVSRIARQLGVARSTIYRAIARSGAVREEGKSTRS